ncbi:MAG: sulfatase-like hydrolase/transferase [Verrucomicrobia bacterium]|nr:sulfatase-like hydrolase/transferase [Verrucomicrobiota bacterium]
MPFRISAATVSVLLAAAVGFPAFAGEAVSVRPNIVFIYADDLGFGDLAGHGHPRVRTPHLDRLAREGADFWSFTVVNPVCSPSRTGIVTGQFPSRWGVHQHFATHELNAERHMPDWLDPRAPLLPRVLREAGYRTAHYGKWHLSGGGLKDAPLPAAYGYDDAAVWTGPGRNVFEGTRYAAERGEGAAQDRHAASLMSVAATDHAVDFISATAGRPFYVNLWLHETHHLVSATEEDKQPYPDVAEPHRTYFAAVTRADRQVGRILAVLDELGLARHTIVIFSSDNGPENSHQAPNQKFYYSQGSTGGLRGRKRSLLMGGVNVPFLVRWPGQVPAGHVDKTTALAGVDVFPTLLAAAGVPPPAGYVGDGENMLAALRGQPQARTKPVFWWWQGHHGGDDWPALAMREGPWVLTLDETRSRVELHDVVADRFQSNNLAASQPERVARMQAAIAAWFDTLPKQPDPALQTKEAAKPARKQPAKKEAAPAATSETRARAFQNWDKNQDGVLTLEEYRAGLANKQNAENRFRSFDRNGDGRLTREEFVGPVAK